MKVKICRGILRSLLEILGFASLTGLAGGASAQGKSLTEVAPDSSPRPGPIRHAQLDPALVKRIEAFEKVFGDLYPITHEQWLDGFKRDLNPEHEVLIWEEIARALKKFTAGRPLSKEVRTEAFSLLLLRTTLSAEVAMIRAKPNYLSVEDTRKVLDLYELPPRPLTIQRQ